MKTDPTDFKLYTPITRAQAVNVTVNGAVNGAVEESPLQPTILKRFISRETMIDLYRMHLTSDNASLALEAAVNLMDTTTGPQAPEILKSMQHVLKNKTSHPDLVVAACNWIELYASWRKE